MNGIDVSSYQSTLNIANVSADFVIVKATEGTTYVNPYCDVHYQQAKALGKKLGVYHFVGFGDPIAEANFFVDNCQGYIGEAIFVLDWENGNVGDVQWALRFLKHVESRIGYKPMIYMSESVENSYDWSSVVRNDNGLWIARYRDMDIDRNYDMSNAGQDPKITDWPFYVIWQWTSAGRLNGYSGNLDCNRAYINGAQWDLYAGRRANPVPNPTTTTTTTQTPPQPEPATTTTTTEATPAPIPTTTTTTTETPEWTYTTTTTRAPDSAAQPSLWGAIIAALAAVISKFFGKETKK